MDTRKKVPEIRFGEFDGEWESLPFASVFSVMQNNTLSRADMCYDAGLAQNIHYGDVLTKFSEHIDVGTTHLPYITNSRVVSTLESSKLANGDVIIADTAEDETAGKCVEVGGISDLKVISGLHTMPCRPSIKFSAGYLGFYMNSPAYHEQLVSLMQGTKVTSISREALKETFLRFSTDSVEQEKIVNVLDDINENITIATKRHEKLHDFKKAMLHRMFPQEGESVPRIRFGKFEGRWEYVHLKKIAGKVVERNDHLDYTETFTNSAEHGIISQRDYFDHDISNADNINSYYIVAENDFVYNPRISTHAPVGPINRNKLERKGIMSPLYTVFRPYDVDYSYLEWFFKSKYWHPYMFYNGDNGARYDRFSIKDDVFFDMPIPHPRMEEQQKIGEYFDTLEKAIIAQAQKIAKLKQMKSALMQKMFI